MSPQDTLYIVAAVGIVILVACIVYITYLFSKLFKRIDRIVENIEETADDMALLKNGVKYAAVSLVDNLLKKFTKGGGKFG